MSNRVRVIPTCFVPLSEGESLDLDPIKISYGYVVYDDADERFADHYETPEQAFEVTKPENVIETLNENGHGDFADFILETGGYRYGSKGWQTMPKREEGEAA